MLECHWELADRTTKTARVVLTKNKVKEVLAELNGGPSGGHLGFSKMLVKNRQRYYGYIGEATSRGDAYNIPEQYVEVPERGYRPDASAHRRNTIWEDCHRRRRIFPRDREREAVPLDSHAFTKWPEVHAIPNQEASAVERCLSGHFSLLLRSSERAAQQH